VTTYRMQFIHVDYWRGAAHRWNNTMHFSCSLGDTTMAGTIPDAYAKMQALCSSYHHGGLAEIAIYNVAGGVPIASNVYFPWATPSSWIPYTGTTGWPGTVPPQGTEAAAHFRTRAGTSKTGKPVYVGIYLHAISGAVTPETGAPDYSSSEITTLSNLYNAFQTLQSGGSAAAVQVTPTGAAIAGSGALEPYVVAHQRVRGRRLSLKQLKADIARSTGGISVDPGSAPVEAE
jgi:hypothetical protein